MPTDTEAIKWAKKLEKVFREAPKGYWFYVASGSGYVMRLGPNGKRIELGNGSFDPDAVLYSLSRLPIALDGGDW